MMLFPLRLLSRLPPGSGADNCLLIIDNRTVSTSMLSGDSPTNTCFSAGVHQADTCVRGVRTTFFGDIARLGTVPWSGSLSFYEF
jgi:hypothetical protein